MRETRALLVETGIREFALRGLDAPSIRSICASAGLTRGAFYTHFEGRDDFFLAVMERIIEEMTVDLPRRGVFRDDVDEVFAVAEQILSELSRRAARRRTRSSKGELRFHLLLAAADRSRLVRARFNESLVEIRDHLVSIFASAQRAGRVRSDLPAEDLAAHVITQALGCLAYTSAGIPVDSSQTLRSMQAFLAPSTARATRRRKQE